MLYAPLPVAPMPVARWVAKARFLGLQRATSAIQHRKPHSTAMLLIAGSTRIY